MASHTVYAVASGKGGVGKTATTVNLGASLAEDGYTVAIVDADLGMANLGGFIGVDPEETLHEVLAGDASLESATYEALNGLAVVPSGSSLSGFTKVDTARLADTVDALRDAFDYVLLDIGAGLSHDSVLPLALADAVVLVSTPQPAAVQDTAKTREVTERLGGQVAGVVLTRAGSSADLELEEVESTLELPVLAVIPDDDAVPASAGEGKAVLQYDPDSPVVEGYHGLAGIIEAESLENAPVVPAVPEPEPTTTDPEPEPTTTDPEPEPTTTDPEPDPATTEADAAGAAPGTDTEPADADDGEPATTGPAEAEPADADPADPEGVDAGTVDAGDAEPADADPDTEPEPADAGPEIEIDPADGAAEPDPDPAETEPEPADADPMPEESADADQPAEEPSTPAEVGSEVTLPTDEDGAPTDEDAEAAGAPGDEADDPTPDQPDVEPGTADDGVTIQGDADADDDTTADEAATDADDDATADEADDDIDRTAAEIAAAIEDAADDTGPAADVDDEGGAAASDGVTLGQPSAEEPASDAHAGSESTGAGDEPAGDVLDDEEGGDEPAGDVLDDEEGGEEPAEGTGDVSAEVEAVAREVEETTEPVGDDGGESGTFEVESPDEDEDDAGGKAVDELFSVEGADPDDIDDDDDEEDSDGLLGGLLG